MVIRSMLFGKHHQKWLQLKRRPNSNKKSMSKVSKIPRRLSISTWNGTSRQLVMTFLKMIQNQKYTLVQRLTFQTRSIRLGLTSRLSTWMKNHGKKKPSTHPAIKLLLRRRRRTGLLTKRTRERLKMILTLRLKLTSTENKVIEMILLTQLVHGLISKPKIQMRMHFGKRPSAQKFLTTNLSTLKFLITHIVLTPGTKSSTTILTSNHGPTRLQIQLFHMTGPGSPNTIMEATAHWSKDLSLK